ncbi:Cobalt transport protein CbiN [uncultured archaeon]|nr:Cobalt transport protein CbiN [uncultured archaeon]
MNRLTIMLIFALLFGATAFIASAGVQGLTGSDDQAGKVVSGLTGGSYHPWLDSLWHPDSEEERLLFSLQAGIGGLLLGYFFDSVKRKKAARE